MKTLEIIHLRLAGAARQDLLEIVREAIGSRGAGLDIRFYHHGALANDLAVHLHRETGGGDEGPSEIGIRLAALLKDYGMVAHAVWTEC